MTAADLLQVAKAPWEEAFNFENTAKAWARIGISPFDQRVYWDLKAKEEKASAVATRNNINPELMTVKGMVGLMFNHDASRPEPAGTVVPAGKQKRKRETLNSSDLWDLPGGAIGDECFNIVKTKVEARAVKAKATAERKSAAALRKTETKASQISAVS